MTKMAGSAKLAFLWLIVFPSKCVLLATVIGGPIAASEDVDFLDGFLYLLQVLTGAAVPLTSWAGPSGTGGVILSNIVAIARQIILAYHIGISAGPLLEPLLDVDVPPFLRGCMEGKFLVARTAGEVSKKFGVFFVLVGMVCTFVAAVLGGLLAAAEGWSYEEGFVMALGAVTSANTVLPSTPATLATGGGVFFGLIIGLVASAILGIVIALASVPLLGFDLTWNDTPVARAPGVLSKEQRERVAAAATKEVHSGEKAVELEVVESM